MLQTRVYDNQLRTMFTITRQWRTRPLLRPGVNPPHSPRLALNRPPFSKSKSSKRVNQRNSNINKNSFSESLNSTVLNQYKQVTSHATKHSVKHQVSQYTVPERMAESHTSGRTLPIITQFVYFHYRSQRDMQSVLFNYLHRI